MPSVEEIYKKFGIPPNLQEHMQRVFGIVSFIEQHWKNKEAVVDWDMLKRAALLHDLGNIVRFDFDKHPEFLGKEQKNVESWKKKQKEVIKDYGSDDHLATESMLREINTEPQIINIIQKKSFGNSIAIINSDNWPLKILYYADLRTLPWGIGTLEERITDIRERMPKYTSRPDFEDLVNASREIEKQIQGNLKISVVEIDEKQLKTSISN